MVVTPGGAFLRRKSITTSSPGLVFAMIPWNCSRSVTGVPFTPSMASPSSSLPADAPSSLTVSTVTAGAYFR